MDLTIIIPAHCEEKKIAQDIKDANFFLLQHHLEGEILVVDDGSTDQTTAVAREAERDKSVRVISFAEQHGKGHAVRQGVLQSRGNVVMFCDSGSCTPLRYIETGMALLQSGRCELAHGSRHLPDSTIVRSHSRFRQMISQTMRWILIIVLGIPRQLSDTQCGFKLYNGDIARALYSQAIIDGFLFDIEIILRALAKNYRIEEFPIEWRADPDSRLSPRRHSGRVLAELLLLIKLKKTLK
jgi:dolichyl-phosphate beta-glucosyltransferase